MKHRLIIFGFLCFVFFLCFFYGWFIKSVFGEEINRPKIIALNFDDGPRPLILEKLLPVLEKYNVPGTFFVMGCAVPGNREAVRKIHDAGHEIENHSWGHEIFPKLLREKGEEAVKTGIFKTEAAVSGITGKKLRFFRPPCWEINKDVENIIISLGYKVMKLENPDINNKDYENAVKHRPAESMIKRVKSEIISREKQHKFIHVLVFHELPVTAEALETLIPYFQKQGYKFVRLDEIYP